MRLLPRRPRRTTLPAEVRAALDLQAGERVLALAVDDNLGGWVVATTYRLAVVSRDGSLSMARPWAMVDAGAWEPETSTLTVTWADGARAGQWSFAGQRTLLPETVRERVQASVVLSTRLSFGEGRTGRVAIRQEFASSELTEQVILGRRVRADDAEVSAAVEEALADLRDQVGLPPRRRP